MPINPPPSTTGTPLRVCSYEDRPEAMDSVILMGESLCRVDPEVSLHLTIPDAPASVTAWAASRSQVVLSTTRPDGVTGWDVKPWLLLQELDAGRHEAIWLDTDIIVTRSISSLIAGFARESLIVTEDWDRPQVIPVCHLWGFPSSRPLRRVNPCFLRATQAHGPLLARWLEMVRDPAYRQAQALPFERRPMHLLTCDWLLTAALESAEFGHISIERLRLGRHIAQCAGSSGYRPLHRLLDLFRGLPPLVHCIGRKPWQSSGGLGRGQRFLLDLATDVSPYVLASRRVAKDLGISPRWLDPRTAMGSLLRSVTACHPAMAGLPLSILHAVHTKIPQMTGTGKP
jgi:hypothetical protein